MPRPPYLLVAFDVDPGESAAGAAAILDDVLAGFPANVRPAPLRVEHVFVIEVPESQASDRFMDVGTYLMLKDHQHQGVLRWVVQLCRVDDIATD